jgi:hypothetical protein
VKGELVITAGEIHDSKNARALATDTLKDTLDVRDRPREAVGCIV